MGKVSVVATLTVKDGTGDGLVSAFDEFLRHVDAEAGTEHYVLHRSTENPNLFFVTEIYVDQAAFDAHAGSGEFAALAARLGDSVETFKVQMAEPVKAVGVEL